MLPSARCSVPLHPCRGAGRACHTLRLSWPPPRSEYGEHVIADLLDHGLLGARREADLIGTRVDVRLHDPDQVSPVLAEEHARLQLLVGDLLTRFLDGDGVLDAPRVLPEPAERPPLLLPELAR